MESFADLESVPVLQKPSNGDRDIARDDTEEEEASISEDEEEGGVWAWMVVLASFLSNLVIDGIGYSFGVLLKPIQGEFQTGTGTASFVGSILAGIILLTGPLAAFAVNRLGTRWTCISGSIISALAILASSYSSSLSLLVLSYGVLGGLGLGLMYLPAVVAVSQYFTRRISLVTGISVCGSGVGTFVYAPIASSLVQTLGWRGSIRVMSLTCVLGVLCGITMTTGPKSAVSKRRQNEDSEDEEEQEEAEEESSMLTVLRSPALLLVMVGNIPILMAVYTTYTYLPSMAESSGFSSYEASLLISVIGVTNTVGRIVSGWVTDLPQVSALVTTILALVLSSTLPCLLPLTTSYPVLVTLTAIYGFVISPLPAVTSKLLIDILGVTNLNNSFGVLTFVRGCSVLLGPPLCGYVLDKLNSQAAPFTLSSIFFASSAVIHLIVWGVLRKTKSPRVEYTAL